MGLTVSVGGCLIPESFRMIHPMQHPLYNLVNIFGWIPCCIIGGILCVILAIIMIVNDIYSQNDDT